MAMLEKIRVTIPPETAEAIRAAVESGEYASASEAVREALRAWTLRRKFEALDPEDLRRLAREEFESGQELETEERIARWWMEYETIREADPRTVAAVQSAVESGEYDDAREVIEEALRSWRFQRLREGRRFRGGVDDDSDVEAEPLFARLKAKYGGMRNPNAEP